MCANNSAVPGTRKDSATASAAEGLLLLLVKAIQPSLDGDTRRQMLALLGKRRRPKRSKRPMSIARLCNLYQRHADTYYRKLPEQRSSEAIATRNALKPLRKLYRYTPVTEFGPLRLKEVREEMIQQGWVRKQVNHQVGRIKRMFRWAVAEELIPAHLHQALEAVEGLRAGHTTARESVPVKPVPEALIEAVLPHLGSPVQGLVKLQLATGMRPGEATIMRNGDIDTTTQPWVYRPAHHKTEHHGHERYVFLGPKAQEIIRPFLKPDQPQAYIFSPIDTDRELRKARRAARKTPLSCGNRRGTNRKRRPKRKPGDHYDTATYARAVSRACELGFPVPEGLSEEKQKQWRREHHWHPHQLRHNAATRLRKEYGIDVAQVVLGHKTLAITQIYAEKDVESAQRAMLAAG